MSYQLGSSDQEQARLERQAQLYNDAQYIRPMRGMNVCEFGCGNGTNLWVAKELDDGKYIGVDIQKKQIDIARDKAITMGLTNTDFYAVDAKQAPIADNGSDLSFTRLVLVHNPEPIHLVREMVRVTKPKGRVLAIEPNNLSYIAYNKPFLNKCYHSRVNYMYQPGKGTLDIGPQLFHLFKQAGLSNVTIRQHSIYCDSRDPDLLKLLYKNWMDMLDSVKDELIAERVISNNDYEAAAREAVTINEGDSIYQCLWIADAVKESK